ncbi:MAG TPA: DUF998 domain-containing protein [Terriglobus sp.]
MPNYGTTRTCLAFAVAIPIVYFGTQLIAAPFFPQYSFTQQAASLLGSPASHLPWIFNTGAMLTGICATIGAYGLYHALRTKAGLILSALIGIAVLVVGITSFKAGLYPLPDPRHSSWQFLTAFIILLPFVLFLASWRMRASVALRGYLLLSLLLLMAVIACMSGVIHIPGLGGGILQRLLAIATFFPVGVMAYVLRKHSHTQ